MSSFLLLGAGTDASAGGGAVNNIALDASTSAAGSNVTSKATAGFTTSGTNRIVVVDVFLNAASTLTLSVSDTSTLTWNALTARNLTFSAGGTHANTTLQRFWALASSALSGDVITATASGTCDELVLIVSAFSGANTSTPFPETQQTNNGTTSVPSVSMTTTHAATTILVAAGVTSSTSDPGAETAGAGSTLVTDVSAIAATNWTHLATQYKNVTSTQSAVAFSMGSSWPQWLAIGDALLSS